MQLGDVAEDGVQGGGIEFTLREQWKVIALGRKEKKCGQKSYAVREMAQLVRLINSLPHRDARFQPLLCKFGRWKKGVECGDSARNAAMPVQA